MIEEAENEFGKIHQTCERLEQVSSRLPGISDLLIKQLDEFCKENVAVLLMTQKSLQAIHQTDPPVGIEDKAREISASLKKKREGLQSQQNIIGTNLEKLSQTSSSILAETNLALSSIPTGGSV